MQCGAKGKQCHKCQKFNYYARVSFSGGKRNPSKINAIKEVDTSDSEEGFFIGTIRQGDKTPAEDWNVDMAINKKNIKLKLDTGAQCNVMPLDFYKRVTSK